MIARHARRTVRPAEWRCDERHRHAASAALHGGEEEGEHDDEERDRPRRPVERSLGHDAARRRFEGQRSWGNGTRGGTVVLTALLALTIPSAALAGQASSVRVSGSGSARLVPDALLADAHAHPGQTSARSCKARACWAPATSPVRSRRSRRRATKAGRCDDARRRRRKEGAGQRGAPRREVREGIAGSRRREGGCGDDGGEGGRHRQAARPHGSGQRGERCRTGGGAGTGRGQRRSGG